MCPRTRSPRTLSAGVLYQADSLYYWAATPPIIQLNSVPNRKRKYLSLFNFLSSTVVIVYHNPLPKSIDWIRRLTSNKDGSIPSNLFGNRYDLFGGK